MKRLFLHIGSHKTGTTSIQRSLEANEPALQKAGLACAKWKGRANVYPIVKCLGQGADFRARIRKKPVGHLLRQPDQSLVLSSEQLFYVDAKQQLLRLKELCAAFDEVQVIVYLRRQDRLALSHSKQVASPRNLPAARFYGTTTRLLDPELERPQLDRYFDYASKIALWQEVFGAENIRVRRYDRASLLGGDVVQDFCSLLGVAASDLVAVEDQNSAINRMQTLVGIKMKERGLPRDQAQPVFRRLGALEDELLRPSRADAEKFLTRYRGANIDLARLLGVTDHKAYFDEDMSPYPEGGNDRWEQLDPSGALEATLEGLSEGAAK